jgi:hypothetical protein
MAMTEFLTCPEQDKSHGIGYFWPAKAVLEDIAPTKLVGEGLNGSPVMNGKHVPNGSTKKKI